MNVIDNKNADKEFLSVQCDSFGAMSQYVAYFSLQSNTVFRGPITRSKSDHNGKADIIVESQGDGLVHHKIDAQKRHRHDSFDAINKEDLMTTTKITDQMLHND